MDELAGTLGYIVKLIAAAGALGTAAFGLVDASKAFWGGMSNPGFGYIRKAVETLLATAGGATAFGRTEIMATLRANWLNGCQGYPESHRQVAHSPDADAPDGACHGRRRGRQCRPSDARGPAYPERRSGHRAGMRCWASMT